MEQNFRIETTTEYAGNLPVSNSQAAPIANENASTDLFKPKHLSIWEEAVGQLMGIHDEYSYGIAAFSWGSIYLPKEVVGPMRGLVGSRIGVLRDDMNRYLFRVISSDAAAPAKPTSSATASIKR